MTKVMPSEQADLVDVFFTPYIRPLGNLVVLFAQAEAEWLSLVIDLIRCTEKEAATKVKQEILTRVNKSGIGDGMRQGLCERRNRLYARRMARLGGPGAAAGHSDDFRDCHARRMQRWYTTIQRPNISGTLLSAFVNNEARSPPPRACCVSTSVPASEASNTATLSDVSLQRVDKSF